MAVCARVRGLSVSFHVRVRARVCTHMYTHTQRMCARRRIGYATKRVGARATFFHPLSTKICSSDSFQNDDLVFDQDGKQSSLEIPLIEKHEERSIFHRIKRSFFSFLDPFVSTPAAANTSAATIDNGTGGSATGTTTVSSPTRESILLSGAIVSRRRRPDRLSDRFSHIHLSFPSDLREDEGTVRLVDDRNNTDVSKPRKGGPNLERLIRNSQEEYVDDKQQVTLNPSWELFKTAAIRLIR